MLDSAGPFFNMLFHCLNMPFFRGAISTCYFHHHLFSTCPFNMLDSAGPFFNMLFHVLNMLLVAAAISTCYIHHHQSTCLFNVLESAGPFFIMLFLAQCWHGETRMGKE
jgi:hypothetical protein